MGHDTVLGINESLLTLVPSFGRDVTQNDFFNFIRLRMPLHYK